MANYQLLKADIDEKVYENARQKITGESLNSVLIAMVTTLGAEYQFAGVATKDTNPEISDAKVFYIAKGKGTYTNFGSLEVTEDEVVVLYYDTEWHKVATGIAADAKLKEAVTKLTEIAGKINTKQDIIPDLESIREGAEKGSTALQKESDPVYLADKPKLALKVEIPDVSGKVDKVEGKGLSSNDFTDAEKAKLAGLENYDDTEVRRLIEEKQDRMTIDSALSSTSTNPVQNKAVKAALDAKQAKLTAGSGIIINGSEISTAYKIWHGSQAEYDAIAAKDDMTIYLIEES